MPIHPLSSSPAPITAAPTRSTQSHLRTYATRAAVVATTSAAAVLLTVLPATAAAPAAPTAPATTVPAAAPAPAAPAPVVNVPVAPAAVSAPAAPARSTAVEHALSKIGASYRWGGNGPSSFDCSGLVNWAFDQADVDLPRTSRALSQVGTPVSRSNLQPGDLVFFYSPVSHVGIYIGDGQMVHASTSGKPVAVDPIAGREFHSARRI